MIATKITGDLNYSATIITVPELRKAQNSDHLYIIDKLGMTAIVDKSWKSRVGELAVLFPAEVQLSHDFCATNNLYRHNELNDNPEEKGYIEDNRRVRAMKLRGNISNGLVLPLTCLDWEWASKDDSTIYSLCEGDVFDTFNGHQFCKKYVVPKKESGTGGSNNKVSKVFRRVDDKYLPMHFDTTHWLRNVDSLNQGAGVVVTQKLHGTSVRLANTVVKRKLTWLDKLASKLGVPVKDRAYDLVAGSRKVIKDPLNPYQQHHYKVDVWTTALEEYKEQIPKNFVVFGELVGYIPGTESPLQKGYTYECLEGEMKLYVYRVAIVTEDAQLIDLSWEQVKTFCTQHGFARVPELLRGIVGDVGNCERFAELNFYDSYVDTGGFWNEQPVQLSSGGTGKDEGIVIRVDGNGTLSPDFYKYKNDSFYVYETNQLDREG